MRNVSSCSPMGGLMYLDVPNDFEQSANAEPGLSDCQTQGLPLVLAKLQEPRLALCGSPAPGAMVMVCRCLIAARAPLPQSTSPTEHRAQSLRAGQANKGACLFRNRPTASRCSAVPAARAWACASELSMSCKPPPRAAPRLRLTSATAAGTATPGTDYLPQAGSLEFADGESGEKVTPEPSEDQLYETESPAPSASPGG